MFTVKMISLLFIFIVFIVSCDILASEEDKDYSILNLDPSDFHEKSWTLLVYMSADNDLEEYAIIDVNELESAFDIGNHDIDVLVLVDRSPGYDESNGDWQGTRLYQVQYDKLDSALWVSKRLASVELGLTLGYDSELDMGSVQTLEKFILDGKNRFDNEYLGFIFWGHGSGFRDDDEDEENITKLVAYDYTDNANALYTQQIANALRDNDINFVGFDACLGGHIEIAYELRDIVDVFVASPDLEYADGWEYDYLLGSFMQTDGTPANLGEATVEAFRIRYSNDAYSTIGAFDLSLIAEVNTKLNAFSEALAQAITDQGLQQTVLNELLTYVEEVRIAPGMLSLDIGDLAQHFAERVSDNELPFLTEEIQTKANALYNSLKGATIAEWHHEIGNGRSNGLVVALSYIDSNGDLSRYPHDYSYIQGESVSYPLSFVADSQWVPNLRKGSGLLYDLFYKW